MSHEADELIAKAIEGAGQAHAGALESGLMTLAESIQYAADKYFDAHKLVYAERQAPKSTKDSEAREALTQLFNELGLPMPDEETIDDWTQYEQDDIPF